MEQKELNLEKNRGLVELQIVPPPNTTMRALNVQAHSSAKVGNTSYSVLGDLFRNVSAMF